MRRDKLIRINEGKTSVRGGKSPEISRQGGERVTIVGQEKKRRRVSTGSGEGVEKSIR